MSVDDFDTENYVLWSEKIILLIGLLKVAVRKFRIRKLTQNICFKFE